MFSRRSICNYTRRPKVDAVAQHLGEDFARDSIHNLSDVKDDNGDESEAAASDSYGETAVAADGEDESAAGSDGDDVTAIAAVCDGLAANAADDKTYEEIFLLSEKQADAVHKSKVRIAALQSSIEALKHTDQLKVVQIMEREISKLKSRERSLASDAPVVAEAFTGSLSGAGMNHYVTNR